MEGPLLLRCAAAEELLDDPDQRTMRLEGLPIAVSPAAALETGAFLGNLWHLL